MAADGMAANGIAGAEPNGAGRIVGVHTMEITVQETAARLRSDPPPKLLDIREEGEWEIVHLPGAVLATQEVIDDVLANWDRDEEIVCYCHHGIRSQQAAQFLAQQGFTNVVSMAGGIEAWAVEIDPKLPRY